MYSNLTQFCTHHQTHQPATLSQQELYFKLYTEEPTSPNTPTSYSVSTRTVFQIVHRRAIQHHLIPFYTYVTIIHFSKALSVFINFCFFISCSAFILIIPTTLHNSGQQNLQLRHAIVNTMISTNVIYRTSYHTVIHKSSLKPPQSSLVDMLTSNISFFFFRLVVFFRIIHFCFLRISHLQLCFFRPRSAHSPLNIDH